MDNFFDRLKIIIDKEADGKHTKFAKLAGIPVSTFQSYLSERIPVAEHLLRIYDTYGISIDWLLIGRGPIYFSERPEVEIPKAQEFGILDPSNFKLIGDIIEGLETILLEEGTNLPPAKKRGLIELLYKYFKKTGEEADKEVMREHLRLITA